MTSTTGTGRAALKWLLAGALISFGVVGFLTGLVLVPFGLWLAASAARTGRHAWPAFLIGLGAGPVALLSGDISQSDPPAGAVPAFWIGVTMIAAGVALGGWFGWRSARRDGRPLEDPAGCDMSDHSSIRPDAAGSGPMPTTEGPHPLSVATTGWGIGAGIVGFITSAVLGMGAAAVTMDPDEGATFIAIWFWLAGPPVTALAMWLAAWWRRWDASGARSAAGTAFVTCLLCGLIALDIAGR